MSESFQKESLGTLAPDQEGFHDKGMSTSVLLIISLVTHLISISPFTWRWASLVAQTVKRLPAMRETQVWFLGREDPLEKEIAIHSSTLAGKSHRRRSLIGYSPWGRKESDTTERLYFTSWRGYKRVSPLFPFLFLSGSRSNNIVLLILLFPWNTEICSVNPLA